MKAANSLGNVFFRHRDGATPIPPDWIHDLKPKARHIQTCAELDELEELNLALGLDYLSSLKKSTLDVEVWRSIHKKMTADVWKWAGQMRTRELAIDEFVSVPHIRNKAYELIDNVKYWTANQTFSSREIAARYHEGLLTIHPFQNVNGRFSRLLINHFCSNELHIEEPQWQVHKKLSPQQRRDNYIHAIKTARHSQNFQPLLAFMF